MFLQMLKITLSSIFLLVMISNTALANSIQAELLKAANRDASSLYVRKHFLELLKQPFINNEKKKALIIGDSHAQDFTNIVFENGYLKHYQISTRDIPTRCQPALGKHLLKYIALKDRVFCAKSDTLEKAKVQIAEADLIIIIASWKEWSAKALPQTIKKLRLKSQQKLLIIGRKSFGRVRIKKYLQMSATELRNLRNPVDGVQEKINAIMKDTLDKQIFINLQQLVCGSETHCRLFSSDVKLITFDGGHLTKHGAGYIGNILFRNSLLGKL